MISSMTLWKRDEVFVYFRTTIVTFKEKIRVLPVFLKSINGADKRWPQTLCHSSHSQAESVSPSLTLGWQESALTSPDWCSDAVPVLGRSLRELAVFTMKQSDRSAGRATWRGPEFTW